MSIHLLYCCFMHVYEWRYIHEACLKEKKGGWLLLLIQCVSYDHFISDEQMKGEREKMLSEERMMYAVDQHDRLLFNHVEQITNLTCA